MPNCAGCGWNVDGGHAPWCELNKSGTAWVIGRPPTDNEYRWVLTHGGELLATVCRNPLDGDRRIDEVRAFAPYQTGKGVPALPGELRPEEGRREVVVTRDRERGVFSVLLWEETKTGRSQLRVTSYARVEARTLQDFAPTATGAIWAYTHRPNTGEPRQDEGFRHGASTVGALNWKWAIEAYGPDLPVRYVLPVAADVSAPVAEIRTVCRFLESEFRTRQVYGPVDSARLVKHPLSIARSWATRRQLTEEEQRQACLRLFRDNNFAGPDPLDPIKWARERHEELKRLSRQTESRMPSLAGLIVDVGMGRTNGDNLQAWGDMRQAIEDILPDLVKF